MQTHASHELLGYGSFSPCGTSGASRREVTLGSLSMSGEVPRLVTITREALRSQGDKIVSTTDSYHTRLGAL